MNQLQAPSSKLRSRLSSGRAALLRGAVSSVVPALLLGCQGSQTHELGLTQADLQRASARQSEPSEPFFTRYDEFVGSWQGTAEAALPLSELEQRPPTYEFPSGSARFALTLRRDVAIDGEETLVGSLTFGEGEPLPPATDPAVGYPLGVNYEALLSYGGRATIAPNNIDRRLPPFEAFPYGVRSVGELIDPDDPWSGDPGPPDGVLTLRFSTTEIVDGWCQLQQAVPDGLGGFSPVPSGVMTLESRGDGSNATCNLFGSACTGAETTEEERAACERADAPVIGQASCDATFLWAYCECSAEVCRAQGVEWENELDSRLLVRRVGHRLIGAFQNEIFLNARNLAVPMGRVRFELIGE